jgi:exonuclease VII large subunit
MSQIPLLFPQLPASWSVTELTRYLRDLLEADELLQDVWVTGEVSTSPSGVGTPVFTIKDSSASCVASWRNAALQGFCLTMEMRLKFAY